MRFRCLMPVHGSFRNKTGMSADGGRNTFDVIYGKFDTKSNTDTNMLGDRGLTPLTDRHRLLISV